jgi:hypothetical protein
MDEYQEYLGDGVYVKFDGYQIVLMANSHVSPTDTIALDPHVIKALIRYVERLENENEL